ncbi:unnamed protein product [Lactuca virosa]|uniref:Uncharacterized protein n=1 Tax=Lactuca virosa TaxID=75947 RepID=A0AAU9MP17_9ASTR|nr:unnamed protein product [Lactuca virosa]
MSINLASNPICEGGGTGRYCATRKTNIASRLPSNSCINPIGHGTWDASYSLFQPCIYGPKKTNVVVGSDGLSSIDNEIT